MGVKANRCKRSGAKKKSWVNTEGINAPQYFVVGQARTDIKQQTTTQ
jgi:hypothetical protein